MQNTQSIYGMRNLFWRLKCHKCYEKRGKWMSAHVCLDMLCFCILKRIGIATLFSQLWILNNFEKNPQKRLKISWFSRVIFFLKIFKILKKSRKKSQIFSIENHMKNQKFRKFWNFKKSKIFDFQYDFQ